MEDYPDLVLQLFCDVCDTPFADLDCCADKRNIGNCSECFALVFPLTFRYTAEDDIICLDCYGENR